MAADHGFTEDQKQYLEAFIIGIANRRGVSPAGAATSAAANPDPADPMAIHYEAQDPGRGASRPQREVGGPVGVVVAPDDGQAVGTGCGRLRLGCTEADIADGRVAAAIAGRAGTDVVEIEGVVVDELDAEIALLFHRRHGEHDWLSTCGAGCLSSDR